MAKKKPIRLSRPTSKAATALAEPPSLPQKKTPAVKRTAVAKLKADLLAQQTSPKSLLPPAPPRRNRPKSSLGSLKAPRQAKSPGSLTVKPNLQAQPQAPVTPVLDPPKKKMGRPAKYTKEEHRKVFLERSAQWRRQAFKASRDIAPLDISFIDWDRRLECKRDLKTFCEEYLDDVFYEGWSADQLKCVHKANQVLTVGGKFALAMPRAGGKTAICRAAITKGIAYGHRRRMVNIGSTAEAAQQTVSAIRMQWFANPKLAQDFPEIAYAVADIDNRQMLAGGQTYDGHSTHIEWTSDRLAFPCLVLPREIAEEYRAHDPTSIVPLKYHDHKFTTISAGIVLLSTGIDGAIRGDAEIHPLSLEQVRPDLVILDDVQKDQKADSPVTCEKMIRIIDGAIQGLSAPGKPIAALMPCTVIREGDVSDSYLDRDLRPEWSGERCRMVIKWPEGIDDFRITEATPAGALWNRYAELRRTSLANHGDIHLATEFYSLPENREIMDESFVTSWESRYNNNPEHPNHEISSQQHAMNLRLSSPQTFPSEFNNIGRRPSDASIGLITSEQLRRKIAPSAQGVVPAMTMHMASYIDVQDEMLFWVVAGATPDFDVVITDYGTYPEISTNYFAKGQTLGWSLLSREFLKAHPSYTAQGVKKGRANRIIAPFEPKIYFGVQECIKLIDRRLFTREDQHATQMRIQAFGVDTKWGQANSAIKRAIYDLGDPRVLPCYGEYIPPTSKQFEEYRREPGWIFEDQINPLEREVKWIVKLDPAGVPFLSIDVSRMKDFLFRRLATDPSDHGSFQLYSASPEHHAMYSDQVCNSEYPEPVTSRIFTKNLWKLKESRPDNEYLDCSSNVLALLGLLGAKLPHRPNDAPPPPPTVLSRKLSDIYRSKVAAHARRN
jgi:hypothetical protein